MELLGIHHVSILTGMAERNYQFYTQILGMRLIKKTVNQDDTTSYHLFYGDAEGNPGTDLTFFDIPHLGTGVPGASSISSTSLRVKTTASLQFWQKRFKEKEVDYDAIVERAGRQTLAFRDQEGTRLILVAEDGEKGVAGGVPWPQEEIPSEHAIVGLGAVTLTVNDPTLTVRVLTEVMGFRKVGTYPSLAGDFAPIEVYATGEGGIGAEVHVETRPDLDRERLGRGGVHHVAFRVPNSDEYEKWVERLNAYHLPNSGKVDRHYFQALYFREPNHILFELSTDTPGFATDESVETLGEKLALPPFLEPKRAAIEARLRPLEI
ncbi:ring-cleaving dioxygenase [Exiguobacterium sp. BMC-KP]|uniref:ring-cleaving dioxygenase n=1 Tax=Exiguobacterium sp. BMC-KP TaxID=1684312 RepID=UPI0006AA455E|nr:ring-cleaving dioxygenase [Exiguobacterium sp. BMC-KP]KOP31244.1 ring-cleaving dioxygenase [Exiguobacterium sp. BMC-KP]